MKFFSLLIITAFILVSSLSAQTYQPYTLGAESDKSIDETAALVKGKLAGNGFKVLGSYTPAGDKNRQVIIITSNDLLGAVKSVGGLTGFASALRVALTVEGGKVLISYTTPEYWGNAYFREDYDNVKSKYSRFSSKLKKAISACGKTVGTGFGSEDGVDEEDLRDYQYMIMMPEFDDTNELKTFGSYAEAVKTIDARLAKGVKNVSLVYSLAIPGKELKLYGVGLSGPDGEADFLPTIDIAKPKHTAFLPYEFLVMGNEVHMLHGRFRIALSFPDLSMGTFTKIMSTPGDIEDMLESIVE